MIGLRSFATSVMVVLSASQYARSAPLIVEASELTKRPDLIGKELLIDDRFSLFVFHKGKGYDEVVLRRAEGVTFRLAQNLRPAQAPRPAAVRVQGVLEKRAGQLVMDVIAMELLPPDLERLENSVNGLNSGDFEKRNAWGRWGLARAEAFSDDPLRAKARQVLADALWIESNKQQSSDGDRAKRWLALADRGRKETAAEPVPSAIAHRAFRIRLAAVTKASELSDLAKEVQAFFPDASKPVGPESVSERLAESEVAVTYKSSSAEKRKELDRALLADVQQAWIEQDFKETPALGLELAERAKTLLPDRPALAAKLKSEGLAAAASSVGKLSRREVEDLAARYRDEMGQPQQARDLLRKWLDDRRDNRLSPTDSDGRVQLALLYDKLLDDRGMAVQLLRAALVIDPQSKEVADTFRRFGFRKVDETWVESATSKPQSADFPEPAAGAGNALVSKGMTREQVKTRLGGKPDSVSRVATQGEILEQWIYKGAKETQIVNFRRGLDRPEPRVVNYFNLP